MKRVIKTIVLLMMVSTLFSVNASAAARTQRKQIKAAAVVLTEMEGEVVEQLPNAMFRVKLTNGKTVTAHVSGKLRMYYIRIQFGDKVRVQISPTNPDQARIIWRIKY